MSDDAQNWNRNRLLGEFVSRRAANRNSEWKFVPLPAKTVVYTARAPLTHAYFPLDGVLSAIHVMKNGGSIELATVGREGFFGAAALIGARRLPFQVVMQIEGGAIQVPLEALKREIAASPQLQDLFARYQAFLTTYHAYLMACNGLHTLHRRCCRWLLATGDRLGADKLLLTHEFLGIMLGVRRAGVTDVLRPLHQRGLIRVGRGVIEIRDRAGLEESACECYRAIRNEYESLLGPMT